MKLQQFAFLLAMVIVFPTFTGCGLSTVEERFDAVEESIEDRIDAAEDAVENRFESAGASIDPAPVPENNQPNQTQTSAATLTEEEATAIALEHAGFVADQVNYLHTEYEIDDGIPQYEVEFHQDRFEYDYTIHAETGAILSFSKDD